MSEVVPGIIWSESEFDGVTGTCGECAIAMAACWSDQRYIGQPRPGQTATSVMYRRMRRDQGIPSGGSSTGGQLLRRLRADGYTVERPGYRPRYPRADWLPFARQSLARPAVVVMELSEGHMLHDTLTNHGEDAGPGLRGHYILVVGYHAGGHSTLAGRDLPEGLWCCDGDSDANNPVVRGHRTRRVAGHVLQYYPVSVIDSAAPCDLLAVHPRAALAHPPAHEPAPLPAGTPSGLAGWHDDGTTLTAPNGHAFVKGFRETVIELAAEGHWLGGQPLAPESLLRDGRVVQPCQNGILVTDLKAPAHLASAAESASIVLLLVLAA